MLLEKYNYGNNPEGTAPFEKILSVLKISLPMTTLMTMTDFVVYRETVPLEKILTRAMKWIPINAMCVVYPSVTYLSTRFRGKDDTINHGIAALACMPLLQAWLKIPFPLMVHVTIFTVTTSLLLKGVTLPFKVRQGDKKYNLPGRQIPGFY